MAEQKEYWLKIEGRLISVTQEIYITYHSMGRRERYLEERDLHHGKVLYSDLDTDETNGEDTIPDLNALSIEEQAVQRILLDKLRACLPLLTEQEQVLIHDAFYNGMSQRQLAEKNKISQPAIKKRMDKILCKLRRMM